MLSLRSVFSLLSALMLSPSAGESQNLFESKLAQSIAFMDARPAMLDREGDSKSLSCFVTPFKAELGFDLRFHFFYEITIPLKELAGAGDELTILLRVVPVNNGGEQTDFVRQLAVPAIARGASGSVHLNGSVETGTGAYHVTLITNDSRGRTCLARWEATAVPSYRQRNLKLAISAGQIESSGDHLFRSEPPIQRLDPPEIRKIKIVINFAPQPYHRFALSAEDVAGLVSILRNIAREPLIARFSITAFNLNEQRVFYRGKDEDEIDFPALGEALASIKPGVIEYNKLIHSRSETAFLSNLMETEVINSDAEAVVLVSPRVTLHDKLPITETGATMKRQLFYMNYDLVPNDHPWRDAIGRIVKHFRGIEYIISSPDDIWSSWADAMGHIARRN